MVGTGGRWFEGTYDGFYERDLRRWSVDDVCGREERGSQLQLRRVFVEVVEVERTDGPGSLVIVGVLASESALLAAAPCVPRGFVQASGQHRDGMKGKFFLFLFTGFLCECVCVRPCPVK